MWYHYLKTAARNLWRNKTFSLINLFGLTIGTVCCLYILLYVQDHYQYDQHHREADNLYRIVSDLQLGSAGEVLHMATCSPPIPFTLAADFPEVAVATRVCNPPGTAQHMLQVDDRVMYAKSGYYVDSTFFRVMDYHFEAGDPMHALDEPYTAVVSAELAQKLFGDSPAINQSFRLGGNTQSPPFKITGIFTAQLGKSHLMPDFFMSMNAGGIAQYVRGNNSWAGNNFIYGYLRLKPGADPKAIEARLPEFLLRHGADQLREVGMQKSLSLQPVVDIHTSAGRNAEVGQVTSSTFLHILLLIAGFIQLVACINFMNLTTARSTRRAQEVGVRKTIGASRKSLAFQFLGESLVLTLVALALAIPILHLSMPFINLLVGAELGLSFSWQGSQVAMVFGLILLTGLLAGSYPAFYLSSFRPIEVLRGIGTNKDSSGTVWLRKGLVVTQLAIAVILIIGAIVIRQQLNYLLEKDLGFEKNQKVVFQFHSNQGNSHLEPYRHELMRLPEVVASSAMSNTPGERAISDIPLRKAGQSMEEAVDIRLTYADDQFFETLKIDLLAGRALRLGDTATQRGVIRAVLNESALEQLEIPIREAPGTVLSCDFEGTQIQTTVVGVMKNVLFESLAEEIGPYMVIAESPRVLGRLVADVQTDDYQAFLNKAEALWNQVAPGIPFEYSFLNDEIARLYETERTLSHIIGSFTLIAILISCLGLFGLSTFAAEQRTKEIGIRKVLGASVTNLIGLLSWDFLKMVLVALVLASPLAWYVMQQWLDDFAYRIEVEWWIFVLAGLLALFVAGLTISYQSVKAALSNPVNSLRSD